MSLPRPVRLSLALRALALSSAPFALAMPAAVQAQQAVYPVVVDQTADPLLSNLTVPANAAQAGMWSAKVSWPIIAIHSALLPDGRVVTFGAAPGGTAQDGRTLVFWDPRKGLGDSAFQVLPNAQNVDSFCGTATLLSDGSLLTSGGASYSTGYSSRESMVLDWHTSTPKRDYDLTAPRWYGTMTKLPDGRALITGGGAPYADGDPNRPDAANDVSSTPEIYTPGQGWRSLTGAYSTDAFGAKNTRWWYPHQWVTATGSVFGISTEKMWEMKVDGNGSIRTIGDFKTAPNNDTKPNTGGTSSAVMFDTGKILQVGGNGFHPGWMTNSSALATVVDITQIGSGQVTVKDTAPMAFPRQWPQATVLPTGRVLVTGGSRYADEPGDNNVNVVYAAETWDPATGRWTTGASNGTHRGYHSIATLLPDGAVLIAGGGASGRPDHLDAEIYYPAYLFTRQGGGSALAARPRIVSLSAVTSGYGQTLDVQTASGDDIQQVSLIAVGSVTHSFDSNQRRMTLSFVPTANGIKVTMPASANLAPPGYYQLSTVNRAGVPSRGVIVAIGAAAPAAPGAASATTAPASGNAQQIGYDTSTIAAAPDGTLATVNTRNQLWVSQMGNNWSMLPGQFVDGAAIANNRYYAIGTDKFVYRWNGSAWKNVGRDSKALAVASDGTVAVINAYNNTVWVKTADDDAESWKQVPGAWAKRLALVKRGALYFVGTDGNVWRSNLTDNPVRVGVRVTAIAAASTGQVTVASTDGSLWRKANDDTVESWTPLNMSAATIATPDATRIVYSDPKGILYAK